MQRLEMERVLAVERYRRGENPRSICASVGRSVRWLYKWVERAGSAEADWYEEQPRRPRRSPGKTPEVVEELVVATREELEREGLFCGAQSIVWELEERQIGAPSIATVNRILKARGCFDRADGTFLRKGRRYPAPNASEPNAVHQNDFVGPRYIAGGVRFYSFNVADVKTGRAAAVPLADRSASSVIGAIWAAWSMLGIPKIFQVDNELVFWGSRRYPRGIGQILRLCLQQGVEPLFIPPAEPWRNGVIEKSNDHWQQKFLSRTRLEGFDHLVTAAAAFDAKRNARWRYSKNGGATPDEALRRSNVTLRFPVSLAPPPLPISKPTSGRYHLIRFIRSDRLLDLFGDRFILSPTAAHEYVTATIDVARQELQVTLAGTTLLSDEFLLR
jgi:putative transposase